MPLFPIPVKGFVPPTNPPPEAPSITPTPSSPITSTVFWNPRHRLELLLTIRRVCEDPHNIVRYVLEPENFHPTSFRGFIEYLATRVRHGDFFRMALSAICEAFRGPPIKFSAEHPDTLRANIIMSIGAAKSLGELIQNRPLSSFSPMFLALFSPRCYAELASVCGFCDPNSLALPRPPGPSASAPPLEVYGTLSQSIETHRLLPAIYALSAHILSVCATPVTSVTAAVIASRVDAETFHEEDAFRLHRELLHFDTHTENRENVLLRVQQLFSVSQHVWLLSKDAVVSICTDGAVRLLYAWVTGQTPPPTSTWADLATSVSTAPVSRTADPNYQLDDHRAAWFLMNLPIALSSAWFLRHPMRARYYDADLFHCACVGRRRQYILGMLYALSCAHHMHDRPLSDDSILRFCIAHAGGVQQPDAGLCMQFDEKLVLVAPPMGLMTLLADENASTDPVLRFSLTPLSCLRTDFQRHVVLSNGAHLSPQAAHQRAFLLSTCTPPTLDSESHRLLPTVPCFPAETFERHPQLDTVELRFRAAYAPTGPSPAAIRGAMINAGLPPSVSDAPPQAPTPQASPTPPAVTDHAAATGVFASLIRPPQLLAPDSPSFVSYVRATQARLHTLPRQSALASQFLAHVVRSTTPPTAGDIVIVPAVTSAGILSPNYALTWQDLFSFPQACYRVSSTAASQFTADFTDVFYARADASPAPWPSSLSLPTPCLAYPELFVLRAQHTSTFICPAPAPAHARGGHEQPEPGSQHGLAGHATQTAPEQPALPAVTQPNDQKQTRRHRSRRHRHKKYGSDSESSDSSSGSSSDSDSASAPKKYRVTALEDSAGIKVMYTKSSTIAQVRKTTPIRSLNKLKPDEETVTPEWMDQILRESGNTLNNYSVDTITTGAIAVWRESFRSLPHYALAGAAHMHPPVVQVAWFVYRHSFQDLALNIIYFNWVEFHALVPTSVRMAHFLSLKRIRQLPHNELATWSDFTDAVHGLQKTYGLYYCPVYDEAFGTIHKAIVRSQLGAMLSPKYLEVWFLDILAFIRRAARDPSVAVAPTDTVRYPHPIIPKAFSAADWCELLLSEFQARVPSLTLANNDSFMRSMSFPVEIFTPHPFGKFQEPGKPTPPAAPTRVPGTSASSPAVPSTATEAATAPAKGRGKRAKNSSTTRNTPAAPTPKGTSSDAHNRICVYSFCHTYKLPLKARGDKPASVPGKCPADCPFIHAQDLPSGTTKAAVLARVQRTVDKILDKPHAEEFANKLQNDSRLA